jgi:hypothetical protein
VRLITWECQNRAHTVAARQTCDEELARPCDAFEGEKDGRRNRGGWLLIVVGVASNQEGIKVGAKFSPVISLRGINGWGKKKLRWPC